MVLEQNEAQRERDRQIGELHYAIQELSHARLAVVLEFAHSMKDTKAPVATRLVRHVRCIFHPDGVTVMRVFWEFDGKLIMSDVYKRRSDGQWTSVSIGLLSGYQAERIEEIYQQKWREVGAEAVQGN